MIALKFVSSGLFRSQLEDLRKRTLLPAKQAWYVLATHSPPYTFKLTSVYREPPDPHQVEEAYDADQNALSLLCVSIFS